jgi:lipoyl(octanoyl) transferase
MARHAGQINDLILILEHFPVLTIGKSGYRPDHILVTKETLDLERIAICYTKRGGGVTYHGPGQLVCYPIFNLQNKGFTVRQYIRFLEEVIINVLGGFNINAQRSPRAPGVWVEDREISSIGIYVSRGITMHGFTLNVSNKLRPFSYIAPCGVPGKKLTSVAQISGIEIPVDDFIAPLISAFCHVFNVKINQRQSGLLDGYYE